MRISGTGGQELQEAHSLQRGRRTLARNQYNRVTGQLGFPKSALEHGTGRNPRHAHGPAPFGVVESLSLGSGRHALHSVPTDAATDPVLASAYVRTAELVHGTADSEELSLQLGHRARHGGAHVSVVTERWVISSLR